MQEEFKNWPEELHRIPAVKRKIGWKGCTLSHQKAVRYAKEHHLPWVLILEDDCQLEKDALKRFQELLPILWDRRSDWDLFSGGMSYSGSTNRVIQDNPPILQAKGRATHFCLLHEGTYDTILNMKMHVIDMFYEENLRVWITVPYIAIQASGHSSIVKKFTNYDTVFQGSTRRFKRTLAKWRKTHKH